MLHKDLWALFYVRTPARIEFNMWAAEDSGYGLIYGLMRSRVDTVWAISHWWMFF